MSRLSVQHFRVLFLLLLLVGAIPMLVSAGAVFDPVQGPTKVGLDYQWSVNVTNMQNPDKVVCISYAKPPAVAPNWTATNSCSCVGANCGSGIGVWTCTLSETSVGTGVFDWAVASWSAGGGSTCGATKTDMGAGTVTPASVSLRAFSGRKLPLTGVLALCGFGMLVIGGVTSRMRRTR